MAPSNARKPSKSASSEHFDVLIVGAGISGVGAAHHMQSQRPEKSFCVLEAMESYGGIWLTHNYPGIRSDSDLFTFGYRFKPWTGAPIASGEEILKYMGGVIKDDGLDDHIRYNHKILTANWSDGQKLWTLRGIQTDTGDAFITTANFLWMCQGYYDHEKSHTPGWEELPAVDLDDPVFVYG